MICQAVLLSVWLQREKEILQNPEEPTVNLHTLLVTLSNMEGDVFTSIVGAYQSVCLDLEWDA